MIVLKTRGHFQAFKRKIGFIWAFFREIWVFQFFKKKYVIFPNFLGGKGLNNYPELIILSHYGLKWEYISIFVEKTPKVAEIRKYLYLVNALPPDVPI